MKKLPLRMSLSSGTVRKERVRTWSSDSGCDPGHVSVDEDGQVASMVDEAVSVWMAMMERHLQLLSHKTKEYLFIECRDIEAKGDMMVKCQKNVAMMLSELPQLVEEVNQEVENVVEAHMEQMAENDNLEEVNEDIDYGARKRKADFQMQKTSPKLRKWCHSCEATNDDDIDDDQFDALLNDWDWSSDEWDRNEDEIYSHILKSFTKSQTEFENTTDTIQSTSKLSKNFYEDNEADSAYNEFNFWKLDHFSPDLSLNIEISEDDLIAIDDPSAHDLLVEVKGKVKEESQDWTRWKFWDEFGTPTEILDTNEEVIMSDWANWKFWNYFGSAEEIVAANEEVLFFDWTQLKFWNEEVLKPQSKKTASRVAVKTKKTKLDKQKQNYQKNHKRDSKKCSKNYFSHHPKKNSFVKLYPKQPRK